MNLSETTITYMHNFGHPASGCRNRVVIFTDGLVTEQKDLLLWDQG